MSRIRHIIKKQTLELSLADQQTARDIQEEVSTLFKSKVMPRMNELFDRLVPADQILQIDRLELDLGKLSYQSLDEELLERTAAILEDEISRIYHKSMRGLTDKTGVTLSQPAQNLLCIFVYLLKSGSHPWNSPFKSQSLGQLFDELLAQDPEQLKAALQKEMAASHVRKRLIYQLTDRQIVLLSQLVAPQVASVFTVLVSGFLKVGEKLHIAGVPRQMIRQHLLEDILKLSIQRPEYAWSPAKIAEIVLSNISLSLASSMEPQGIRSRSGSRSLHILDHIKTALNNRALSATFGKHASEVRSVLNRLLELKADKDKNDTSCPQPPQTQKGREITDNELVTGHHHHEKQENDIEELIGKEKKDDPLTPPSAAQEDIVNEPPEDNHSARSAVDDGSALLSGQPGDPDAGTAGSHDGAEQEITPKAEDTNPAWPGHQEPLISGQLTVGDPAGTEGEGRLDPSTRKTGDLPPGQTADSPAAQETGTGVAPSDGEKNSEKRQANDEDSTRSTDGTDHPHHFRKAQSEEPNPEEEYAARLDDQAASKARPASPDQQPPGDSEKTHFDNEIDKEGDSAPGKTNTPDALRSDSVKEATSPEEESLDFSTPDPQMAANELKENGSSSRSTASNSLDDDTTPQQKSASSSSSETHEKPGHSPVPLRQGGEIADGAGQAPDRQPGVGSAKKERPHRETARSSMPSGKFSTPLWRKPPAILEEAHIHNAGLALLWPYLGILFKGIGWVQNDAFLSEERQFRAVHLMQYMVTGEVAAEEQELTFNKLLVGMTPESPVPYDVALTQDEMEEAEHLLQTVLDNWKALKTKSTEALRLSFLQKEGILKKDFASWKLYVERSTIDVLLDRLPWSYRVIKLPWMDNLINVEW